MKKLYALITLCLVICSTAPGASGESLTTGRRFRHHYGCKPVRSPQMSQLH